MIEEVVPAALAGERLDRIVALMADISRSEATSTLQADGVLVDGRVVRSGKLRLPQGSTVTVDTARIPVEDPPGAEPSIDFEVLHVDDDIIVIDKPAGLVVHPGAGHDRGTLVNGLLDRFPEVSEIGERHRPGIVHRLDRGTSGLLVVARSARAYSVLVDMMASHSVEREYTALVWGIVEADSSTIDAPIGRDPQNVLRMAVVPSGKDARTHVEVLERFSGPEMSLVRCELETGRTHQIRVHLRAIGHPVVGDPVYGSGRATELKRPFLHAGRLAFEHPVTGVALEFESRLPEDLREFLEGMKKDC